MTRLALVLAAAAAFAFTVPAASAKSPMSTDISAQKIKKVKAKRTAAGCAKRYSGQDLAFCYRNLPR